MRLDHGRPSVVADVVGEQRWRSHHMFHHALAHAVAAAVDAAACRRRWMSRHRRDSKSSGSLHSMSVPARTRKAPAPESGLRETEEERHHM